jgi:hypothetical protein
MPGDSPDSMPLWVFAVVFLGSPVLMAIAVTAARYRHELAESNLAVPLILGHLVCAALFVGVWRWRRREGKD